MQTDDKAIYHFNKMLALTQKTPSLTKSTFGIHLAFE